MMPVPERTRKPLFPPREEVSVSHVPHVFKKKLARSRIPMKFKPLGQEQDGFDIREVVIKDPKRKDLIKGVFEPLIISDIKRFIEYDKDQFRNNWIERYRTLVPEKRILPVSYIVRDLVKFTKATGLEKRMALIEDLDLDMLNQFINYTKCFVKEYSQTYFWRYLYLWSYRQNYPRSKRDKKSIVLSPFMIESLYRLAAVAQTFSVSTKTKDYDIKFKTINSLIDKTKPLGRKYPMPRTVSFLRLQPQCFQDKVLANFQMKLGPAHFIGKELRRINSCQNRISKSLTLFLQTMYDQ